MKYFSIVLLCVLLVCCYSLTGEADSNKLSSRYIVGNLIDPNSIHNSHYGESVQTVDQDGEFPKPMLSKAMSLSYQFKGLFLEEIRNDEHSTLSLWSKKRMTTYWDLNNPPYSTEFVNFQQKDKTGTYLLMGAGGALVGALVGILIYNTVILYDPMGEDNYTESLTAPGSQDSWVLGGAILGALLFMYAASSAD
jgi:hypothetical protein